MDRTDKYLLWACILLVNAINVWQAMDLSRLRERVAKLEAERAAAVSENRP